MTNPAGESDGGVLRVDFDRRLMLQFRGSVVTSDAGLLAYHELDDVLGLSALASDVLADPCTGRNGRHALAGLFRQSVFGRLAGYDFSIPEHKPASVVPRVVTGDSVGTAELTIRYPRNFWKRADPRAEAKVKIVVVK